VKRPPSTKPRRSTRSASRDASSPLLLLALGEAGGAALVLDDALRLVAATPAATELFGVMREGTSAPRLLCGEAVERPVAEALEAGRPVSATIPRPHPDGGTLNVRVRAIPLGRRSETARPPGWLLLVDAAAGSGVVDAPLEFHGMWTRDAGMKRLFEIIAKVARTEASVLVRGETGAGKELVARALHDLSPRRAGPFRALNCAALPPALLESELFGHVRGAFTGAVRDNPGHFRLAAGGTLFLDEVAELPLELQAKLLRVLDTRTVIPVGGGEPLPVDVRVIAATHRSLRAEVAATRFRADLMYRLRVVPLFLPPLRARQGDVALLGIRIMEELNRRHGRQVERLSAGALAALERHDWPGNVRELRNALEYAYAIGEGAILTEAELPPEITNPEADPERAATRANAPPSLVAGATEPPEATRIRRALERVGGSRERAARLLGVSRATLWRRMRALGLSGVS
jgi:transcriptional regulator with PAS, ATPase and Fis domain